MTLLALPTPLLSLLLLLLPTPSIASYKEHLTLLPLPSSKLLSTFTFTARTPLAAYTAQHFTRFPRSLAQILQATSTEELHLRFSSGRWDDDEWGRRRGEVEGVGGVEMWAWLDGGEAGVEAQWQGLVNSLSGLFCASLNFIDSTRTTKPVLTFSPKGRFDATAGEYGTGKQLRHGTLPHEVVCTENLTPFLKLLPCKGKAGIARLLDGHRVFDADWQSMAVDVRKVCSSESCEMEIQQTVDMVLDIERSSRPRHDPIPRPKRVEELECDTTKSYNGHDTCFPMKRAESMPWTFETIFGRDVQGRCHFSDSPSTIAESEDSWSDITILNSTSLPSAPLTATRHLSGSGQASGVLSTVLVNHTPKPQTLVYFESLPWFLRPYLHTLRLTNPTTSREVHPDKMFYTPALDRIRGTSLELLLTIPAHSKVELEMEFEKAGLRYTEYPPDANRGFDVPGAVIRVLQHPWMPEVGGPKRSEVEDGDYYLRTPNLLLVLPTPDFSMPYNVIILTSTVVALGFGSIFNLLVRRFVLVEEVPESPLGVRVKAVKKWVQGQVAGLKGKWARSGNKEGETISGVKENGSAGGASSTGLDDAGVGVRKR